MDPCDDLEVARRQLRQEGWCVIPDVLDSLRTSDALSQLWVAAAESERRGVPTFLPTLDPNASNVRVFYLLEGNAVFRELIQHPLALDIVRSVLGPEFLISNFTANI